MKGRGNIFAMSLRCITASAELLAPLEREVVLGDLAETGREDWRGLGDVLSLVALRQFALWRSWRPWAASAGLALPASLFLMGCSLAASGAISNLLIEPSSTPLLLWRLISRLFLLICWAWMTGFAVSALSRGTLWASLLGCLVPCLYCLSRWPGHGLSELQLLLFLVPGLWGVSRGWRELRLSFRGAVFLATMAMLTPLMWGKGGWMYGCWLLWPGWYLAATAKRRPV
jgi:hypothetical protein